jgi:cysteine desulfurase
MIHLNHAGASPSSVTVVQRIKQHLDEELQFGGYTAKEAVNAELALVYQKAATLIGAASPREIALTESATTAWTRLFYAFASHREQYNKRPATKSNNSNNNQEKIILISQVEYAANVVAACQWARTHEGWSVLMMPSCETTGTVDVSALQSILAGTYKHNVSTTNNGGGGCSSYCCCSDTLINPESIALVCITHIPTNSGIVNPVNDIGQLIAAFNEKYRSPQSSFSSSSSRLPPIFYLADTCQSVG